MGRYPNNKKSSGRGNSGFRKKGKGNGKDKKPTARKGLSDYQYTVGSAKQASDFVTVTNYLVNYIRRTYVKGEDIANALENLEDVDLKAEAPSMRVSINADPQVAAREDEQFKEEYKIEYTEYNRRLTKYKENKVSAEALLWNQCSNIMRSKIQSRKDYESTIKGDPVMLLTAIKEHALSYESTRYRQATIFDSMKSLLNLRQKDEENSIDYLKRFKAARDVFYSHVGKGFCFPRVSEDDEDFKALSEEFDQILNRINEPRLLDIMEEMRTINKKYTEEFMAYAYLENTDKSRYGSIMTGLETQFSLDHDQYPKTLISAQNVVDNHTYDADYKKKKKQREENNRKEDKKEKKEAV